MKKTIPVLLGFACGMFVLLEHYIVWSDASWLKDQFLNLGQILMGAAFILGGISIIQVNWPKIQRREQDWQFKVVLLASALVMVVVGIPYRGCDGAPTKNSAVVQIVDTPGQTSVEVTGSSPLEVGLDANLTASSPNRAATLPLTGDGKELLLVRKGVQGYEDVRAVLEVVPATMPTQVVYDPDPCREATDPGECRSKAAQGGNAIEKHVYIALHQGQTAKVVVEPQMKWGKEGRVFNWLFKYVFEPCNKTMFSLLAFFIASAAFRAFRASNFEATVLLGSAIIILLGLSPSISSTVAPAILGDTHGGFFAELKDWILEIPNNAAYRAIMIGAALGGIATGLRIILGLERSHLGGDS